MALVAFGLGAESQAGGLVAVEYGFHKAVMKLVKDMTMPPNCILIF